MELISVIIPVYNTQGYLEECINSVIKQTYSNIEIIIIDDGSTDNSPFIIDRLAEQDHRIRAYHKANEGVAIARNTGLDTATGKYIVFLDSDDSFCDCAIEKLYTQLCIDKSDIAVCGIMQKDKEKSKYCTVTDIHKIFNINKLNETFLRDPVAFSAVNKLYKTECIGSCRFPSLKMCEDAVFIRKVFLNCKNITLLAECLYINNQREDSATKKGLSEEMIEDELRAIRIMDNINNPQWAGNAWRMSPGILLFELIVASMLSCKSEPLDRIFNDKYFRNMYQRVKLPSKKANAKKAIVDIILQLKLYNFLFFVTRIYKSWR